MPAIGVIGAGSRGMDIVRICQKHGALGGVADLSTDRLRRVSAEYPLLHTSRDPEAIFQSNVEAVVIATPTHTHVELALRAIHYGKHIFVDRPLSMSEEGAVAIARKAERARCRVFVGHQLLHHPAIVAQRLLVQNGTLGEVLHVRARCLTVSSPRSDENVWWCLAPDDVALIVALLGEPIAVGASQHRRLDSGIADFVYADMQFSRQRSAHIEVSWLDPNESSRIDVFGTKGIASVETAPPVPFLKLELSNRGPTASARGFPDDDHPQPFTTFAQADANETEFLAFVQSLSSDVPAISNAANGIRTARVLNAVTRAGLYRAGEYTIPRG
jgi:predicted dehydrogenase